MSIAPARFSLTEHKNQNWTLTVEAGTSVEDIMNPAFLANVAARLEDYDIINVRIDTGEWFAQFLVVEHDRAWAKLIKLTFVELVYEGEDPPLGIHTGMFSVEFKGPHNKWCVIRQSDKVKIKEQCASKAEANAWLSSYTMTL